MNVLIISIYHVIQRARRLLQTPKIAAQRDQLEALIRRELNGRSIRFIADESDLRLPTIAQQVASSSNPPIPWVNIIMTEQQRRAASIFEALQNRPVDRKPTFFGYTEIEHRAQSDDVRENFFMAETITGAGTVQNILVLCSDIHTEALAIKFRTAGHTADTNNSLCSVKHWLP